MQVILYAYNSDVIYVDLSALINSNNLEDYDLITIQILLFGLPFIRNGFLRNVSKFGTGMGHFNG